MRSLTVAALTLAIAVLVGTSASAKPLAPHKALPPQAAPPAKPDSPTATPGQAIPSEDLEGITVRHRTYEMGRLPGSSVDQQLAGILVYNLTRYNLTSVTFRLQLLDDMGKTILATKLITVTSFMPDSAHTPVSQIIPDAEAHGVEAIGVAPSPSERWLTSNDSSYWMTLVAARGIPAVLQSHTPQGAFLGAAAFGDMAQVQAIAAAHPELIAGPLLGGQTALDAAACGNHLAVARFLLEHGADLEAKDDLGQTPLFWAVSAENLAIVRLLLSRHADPLAKDKNGTTCLDKASEIMKRDPVADVPGIFQMVTDASQGKWPQNDVPKPAAAGPASR